MIAIENLIRIDRIAILTFQLTCDFSKKNQRAIKKLIVFFAGLLNEYFAFCESVRSGGNIPKKKKNLFGDVLTWRG
jgi:hypothetical protein